MLPGCRRRACGAALAALVGLVACVTPLRAALVSALGAAPLGAALVSALGAALVLLWRRYALVSALRAALGRLRRAVDVRRMARLGERQRRKLDEDTLDVQRVQRDTLLKRLRKNADTAYGRQCEFSSIKDTEDFRQRVPLTTCEHYTELLDRNTAGAVNVLVTEKPVVLATTSATSGSLNLVLNTKDTSDDFFLQGLAVCADVRRRSFSDTHSLQRTLWLFPPRTMHRSGVELQGRSFRGRAPGAELHGWSSRGGAPGAELPTGPDPCTLFTSNHVLHFCTTPPAALRVQSERDLLYLHLLFALKERHLGTVESRASSVVLYAFRTLQERWEELVDDVESGRISGLLALDADVRAALERLVQPDPERAAELRAQLSQGFRGVARRLWPRLHLVVAVDSGPEHIYGELLSRLYCEGLPLYSPLYAAPEGLIGVNLWPRREARHYLLCPRSMFCEFVPEERVETEELSTLLMAQVEVGQRYELVITNAAGLYRYRTGDVVKVIEFHNQCPVVELLYRRGETLSVRGEKVSERLFLSALKKAVSQWPGTTLLDYCCAESGVLEDSSGGAQPHYLVFLELKGVRNFTEEQRYKLDSCLQGYSSIYKSFRIKGSIGPMRVQLVSEGSLRELRGGMMSFWNISPNELRIHRVIRYKEHADFLLERTIS